MKALALLAVLVVFGCGCAGDNDAEASLSAFSESNGVLHVSGSGWGNCGRVKVKLPEPWGASTEKKVAENGRFSLAYAHPGFMPYEGTVRATCTTTRGLEISTEIRVGDSRAEN